MDNLYRGFGSEMDDLYEYKSSRSKIQHIPDYNKDNFITLKYVRWLCKRVYRMLDKGAVLTPGQLIESLQSTDWSRASYDAKYKFTNPELCKILMVKKVPKDTEYRKRFELLDKQAEYMAKASKLLCGLLDDDLEYNAIEYENGKIKKEK